MITSCISELGLHAIFFFIRTSKFWPSLVVLNPRSLEGGGGQIDPPPLDFFDFQFLLLDRLSKALAQLFLVCEHIF